MAKTDLFAQTTQSAEAQGGINALLAQSANAVILGKNYVRSSAPIKDDVADTYLSPAFVLSPNPATETFAIVWQTKHPNIAAFIYTI
jgi:hypothetical protein